MIVPIADYLDGKREAPPWYELYWEFMHFPDMRTRLTEDEMDAIRLVRDTVYQHDQMRWEKLLCRLVDVLKHVVALGLVRS